MKKLFLLLLVLLMAMPLINAAEPECDSFLPPSKLGDNKTLIQTCANCTFVNITTMYYPPSNGTLRNLNVPMTRFANTYNYTFTDNRYLGTYIYSTLGNPDGVLVQGNVCYEVTPSGTIFTNALSIPVFLPMLLMLGIAIFFFFLSGFMSRREYFWALIVFGGIFLIFSVSFGIMGSREILWGFPLLYNFINSFSRIFIVSATWGAIIVAVILMFFVVKRAFDSRGYNITAQDYNAYVK